MALRNSPLVAEKTRERIQRVANEVGYRPNRLAMSLKSGASKVIGFVIPSFTYPYYSLLAEYVFREAARQGYQVQFVLSGSDQEQESSAITECLDAQVDGLIVRSVIRSKEEIPENHALQTVLKRKFPCVMGNNLLGFPGVSLDHHQASKLAVEHLLEQGYEEIRLLQLGRPRKENSKAGLAPAAEQSAKGFREALEESGAEYDPSMLVFRDVARSKLQVARDQEKAVRYVEYEQYGTYGEEMMEQVLAEAKGKRLGIVFGHDQMACAAWRYCMNQGIRVPETVGIVGRGNVSTYMLPLTTIGWDYEAQAKALVSVLLKQINSPGEPESCQIKPYLAVRGSTAPAAPSGN